MTNDFNFRYQYDRCYSRGICSINPTTSSLQEIILLYLKQAAYYGIEFEKKGISNNNIRNLILNTISILSSNYEISENNFNMVNSAFKQELPKIIEQFKTLSDEENPDAEIKATQDMLNKCSSLNDYIRLGEREFNRRVNSLSAEFRNLYKILFVIVKSICVNILICESFDVTPDSEVKLVFEIFNLLNNQKTNKNELEKTIVTLAKADCNVIKQIQNKQEEFYGIPSEHEVSFSTSKGKCVLVVGSNLRELECILDKLQEKKIDVYTHDNMILAHSYPKFKEYKNLKGQFGQGMENCLLDFSTFPGPILLTRYSLYNVENLYRGLLYTTDFAYSKGVIQIKNDDFSEVITSAINSKGFKTGKKCPSGTFGFNYQKIVENIKTRLETKKYTHIFVIGPEGYTKEEKDYFKTLIKRIPKNILIISFACCDTLDNLICLNSPNDINAFLKLSEELITMTEVKKAFFLPYCDRHTLSVVLYLNSLQKNHFFIGKWKQNILNPNILDGITNNFNIKILTTPKENLSNIIPIN